MAPVSIMSRMSYLISWLAVATIELLSVHSSRGQDLWQGQSIYQVVTDRFFNGDVANDNADGNFNPSAAQAVQGGDFKGIEQKLDYIKALGATAIWISPVVANGNGDYHGYAGRDFFNVAAHWGSLADLKHLIDAAHAKGLLVIDDVVVNHGGQLLSSNDSGYPNFKTPPAGYGLNYRDTNKQYAPPFDSAANPSLSSLFHNQGFIQDFNSSTQVELGSLEGLDDFRTESDTVRTQMANIYNFWIDQGFDAFRVDTVKHVEAGFWQSWCPAIHQHAVDKGKPNFFLFGEVYDGSEAKLGSYTGTKAGGAFELDSAVDYPLYFSINGVFASATANTRQLEDHYRSVDANLDPAAASHLVTFVDNHDQPRFLNSANANNDAARLKVALSFLYTSRGIPCLYYGTEQGFNGGADPANREDMFAGQWEQGPSSGDNFNETHDLFQYVAKLNNLRRLYPALATGTHVNQWNDASGPGLFAYSRIRSAQEALVVLNTGGVGQTLPPRPSSYPPGTVLVNQLDAVETITVRDDRNFPSINVPATSAKIFVAQADAKPLDPVVTSISPAHDARNVPTPAKVVLTFSKSMDPASVEGSFSTTPATTGSFTWSPAHDQLTYAPNGGLPELTTLAVRLSNGATAADGTRLFTTFDARLATAAATVADTTLPTVTMRRPTEGTTFADYFQPFGFAADDVDISRVELQIDSNGWFPVSTSIFDQATHQYSWSWSITPQNFVNGLHTISVRSVDTAGNA